MRLKDDEARVLRSLADGVTASVSHDRGVVILKTLRYHGLLDDTPATSPIAADTLPRNSRK